MAFWSGEKLGEQSSVVGDFVASSIDANAYNLRMGAAYFRTGDDTDGARQKKTTLGAGEAFLIPAGQFAFLLSKESIHVPMNAMAFISMRTGIKFQGLINVSGFHVDPGYSGKLIYAVYNASPSPIQICEGDPIFKVWFADLDRASEPKYVFQGEAQSDISNNLIRGMSKELFSLQNLAEKMRELEASVNARLSEQKPIIDNLTFVWRTITLAVVGAAVIALMTVALPSLMSFGSVAANWLSTFSPSQ